MRAKSVLFVFLLTLTVSVNPTSAMKPAADGRKKTTGIKESVPDSLRPRYERWKSELLSTEIGRRQWESYSGRTDFLLTIVVSKSRRFGAGTDDFEWNDDGRLVAATITVGHELDKGYPDPVYYPVMNSLATYDHAFEIDGDLLASTKLIHELAHVDLAADTDSRLYRRQNKLIDSYNLIFLRNGYDVSDPRLVVLAEELGKPPIEIWQEREYQSEVRAMQFLIERLDREPFSCYVFDKMRRNISEYAGHHRGKFASFEPGAHTCRN